MKKIRKFDAIPKVKGLAKFIDDYEYENMLHAKLLYSKIHHGKIKKISYPKEFNLDEFAIISVKDIPGENIVPEPVNDQPFMVDDEVLHYGQIIRVIAHEDKGKLEKFIFNTKVIYEELPAKTDFREVLKNPKNAFGKTHIINHSKDIEPKKNWIRHFKTYSTPHQEQFYLEPQGVIAVYNEKDKTSYVKGTFQCPYFVKAAVDNIMGDSINQSIVETSEAIGGAFGGKEDYPNIISGVASLLSYKTKKPIKLILNREEDLNLTTKRHPSHVEIETYTDPETSEIKKMKIDYRLDAGAYQTISPVVLSRGILHSSGGYKCDDIYIKGEHYQSNTPPNGAYRGFGAPQGFFAIESHIDNIARDLRIDPYDFRKKNIFHIGDEFPTTQKVANNNLETCMENVITKSDYKKKLKEFEEFNKVNDDKKGIGMSIFYHGGGFTGNGEKQLNSEVKMTLYKNGTVKIFVVNVDMGQGAHSTLPQMVAESLEISREKISVEIPNTSKAPNSGPTVASRTIYIVGNLLKKLSEKIKSNCNNDVDKFVEENQDSFPKDYKMRFVPEECENFDEDTYRGMAYRDFSHEAAVAEIYYHADTYQIELKKLWLAVDIGNPVDKEICIGQIQGGSIQAAGYSTTEYWHKSGFGVKGGISGYIVPTTLDVPKMDITFVDENEKKSKGIGELPMDGPAPAIRNAFLNATGIEINEIPLIPETIFKNIEK